MDNSFGLKPETVEKIQKVFESHAEVEKAVIYGSRAKGNYREGSDIDVTLFGKISFRTLGDIFDELDDLMLPYSFDLSVFSDIESESLKDHIKRIGKGFYEKNKTIPSSVLRL